MRSWYPAASVLAALEWAGTRGDGTLIMADIARKAIAQAEGLASRLLERRLEPARARDVARLLATGVWTHDHPLQASDLQAFGLRVETGVGDKERELLALYPQPRGRETAVEYSIGAPEAPATPRRPDRTPGGRRARA